MDLTEDQTREFKRDHFQPIFKKYARGRNKIRVSDAVPFMQDLMTWQNPNSVVDTKPAPTR